MLDSVCLGGLFAALLGPPYVLGSVAVSRTAATEPVFAWDQARDAKFGRPNEPSSNDVPRKNWPVPSGCAANCAMRRCGIWQGNDHYLHPAPRVAQFGAATRLASKRQQTLGAGATAGVRQLSPDPGFRRLSTCGAYQAGAWLHLRGGGASRLCRPRIGCAPSARGRHRTVAAGRQRYLYRSSRRECGIGRDDAQGWLQ